ncbi:MAG: hypothetical protein KGI28_00380 [Thaumarchaeota archaeon]|nr:hypothetical protein [Nitrososphaerota archaeon]
MLILSQLDATIKYSASSINEISFMKNKNKPIIPVKRKKALAIVNTSIITSAYLIRLRMCRIS